MVYQTAFSALASSSLLLLQVVALASCGSREGPLESGSADPATSTQLVADPLRPADDVVGEVPRDEAASERFDLGASVAIAVLSASLLLALATISFLLRWRRVERNGQLSLAPVELLDRLAEQERSLAGFAKSVERYLADSSENNEHARKAGSDLLEAFTGLQKALDEKDDEIRRLRHGYDAEVFRRFLNRFLRVHRALEEELEDSQSDEAKTHLVAVRAVLVDALEECGVEPFSPELGESVRSAFGIDDGYKTVPTQIEDQSFTIAEVLEPGMRVRTPDGGECLTPARVSVYVYSEERDANDGEHHRD